MNSIRFIKSVLPALIFLVLMVVELPANASAHLPDCKKNPGCFLELREKLLSITLAELQAMIDAGAYVNATNDSGTTLLHILVPFGKADLISTLINAGADANAKDSAGNTPFHNVVVRGDSRLVSKLSELGIDSDDTVTKEIPVIISMLLKSGADVNAKNKWGKTPLHEAAFAGIIEVIPMLVEAGANVNQKDNNGDTPLDLAKKEKH